MRRFAIPDVSSGRCGRWAVTHPHRAKGPAQPRVGQALAERLLKRRFLARHLPELRVQVEKYAAGAGLPESRRGDFVLAVDEIATNAVEHAGGAGALLLRRVGDELECRISDSGPGFSPSLIPRVLPGLDGATSGRGLWLTQLVTDRLAVARGEPGAVVTLAMRLPRP